MTAVVADPPVSVLPESTNGSPAYHRRLGWVNVHLRAPVVEVAGVAWMTRAGVPVMVPDHWSGRPDTRRLPDGTRSVPLW